MPSLSEANAKFGFSIFREFKQNAEDNLVISPLSISTVMAMVLLGAREKTAFEMQKVLCLDEVTKGGRPSVGDSRGISVEAVSGTPGEIHSQFHSLLEEINKPNDDYSLAVANRLYGSQTFEFLQPYLDGVKDVYKAGLETMDFLHASEDSRGKINSWVENQTNGKIKELFSAGTIDPATVLVLANAIYFKGKWAMKFKQENTQERNFRTNKIYWSGLPFPSPTHFADDSGEEIEVGDLAWPSLTQIKVSCKLGPHLDGMVLFDKEGQTQQQQMRKLRQAGLSDLLRDIQDTSRPVQMMKQTGFFNIGYIEESQGKILELPYTNNHLSMFVLLPSDNISLEKFEQDLTFEKLVELMNPENMARKEVNLHFPRFRVEETYSLKPILEAMGMRDIFDTQNADFSGMTTQKGLAVSKIIHKSYVEVNEEGTEAAAATGVVVGYNSSRKEEFNCDHPFLFLIRHNKSKSILFYGRVAAP